MIQADEEDFVSVEAEGDEVVDENGMSHRDKEKLIPDFIEQCIGFRSSGLIS